MTIENLDKVLGSGYEAKLPDLDWASLEAEKHDNIPTELNVEAVPQLVEQWSNRPEVGTRLVGLVEGPVGKKASDVTEGAIAGVVDTAKREMMMGLKGRELAQKLASLYPPSLIKAAKEGLKTVAEEQGLLGGVYVDLSVFDSCREASRVLGPNRIRLANYVVGTPKRHVCSSHIAGYCKELRKNVVSEVPYGDDLYQKYTDHLRVAGVIGASESVTDKDTLRQALLRTPEPRKRATSIDGPAKAAAVKVPENLDEIIDKAASEREAAEVKYASERPVLSYMQGQMLHGLVGDELKNAMGAKFPQSTIKSCQDSIRRTASLQGLLGTVYVDVGLFKDASEAAHAISSAKTRPSYLVDTRPGSEYDSRVADVSKATGCLALPRDGAIDTKVARSYVDDLRYAGRVSTSEAERYAARIEAGDKPLAVLRDAFITGSRPGTRREAKSGAQMGTWFTGTSKGFQDHSALQEAASKALQSGIGMEKVIAKVAGQVPSAEAIGLVRTALGRIGEVDAACLDRCSLEVYPISKSASIRRAPKCEGCVNGTGTVCLVQRAKFAGALDLDKAFVDMTVLTAAEEKKEKKSSGKAHDPSQDIEPVTKKVLLSENPDVERADMKQKYDMSDEFGSNQNKVLDRMRAEDELPKKKPSEKKSEK